MSALIADLHEELRAFVAAQVYYCVSQLISHLAKDTESEYYDEIVSICIADDYESAAYEQGYRVEEDAHGCYIWLKPLDKQPSQSDLAYESEAVAWMVCCDQNNIAYEHPAKCQSEAEFWYTVIAEPTGGYCWVEKVELEQSEESFNDELDAWRDCCEVNGIDPQQTEAYEHWIVSDWLAQKLAAKGSMVGRDIYGLTVWGRCTTGQAICMDGVIGEIYRELHELD
jgi:hypothetical protein